MVLRTEVRSSKEYRAPLHSPHPAPYRSKENRNSHASSRMLVAKSKIKVDDLLDLQESMTVRPLLLETHSTREKLYMRRVMQNRGNTIHAIVELSKELPFQTQRKGFRIH